MPFLDEDGVTRLTKDYLDIFAPIEEIGEGDGTDAGPIYELSAKGHAEQFSTTGKNLLDESVVTTQGSGQVSFPFTNNGIVWAQNNDGSITAKGTLSASQTQCLFHLSPLTAGIYTISGCPVATGVDIYPWDKTTNARPKATNGTSGAPSDTGNGASFLAVDGHEMVINLRLSGQDQTFDLTFYPQLEAGSTATSYEPYTGGAPSPSPDYPQDIEVVRGRNLLDPSGMSESRTVNGVTFTNHGDGSFSVSGTTTSTGDIAALGDISQIQEAIKNGGTFTLSCDKAGYDNRNFNYAITYRKPGSQNNEYLTTTATIPPGCTVISFNLWARNGVTMQSVVHGHFQLELGPTPTPYVPYGYVGMEVQGKNLLPKKSSTTMNGITYTVNSDGSVTVNGTATSASNFVFKDFLREEFTDDTYFLSGCPSGGSPSGYYMRALKPSPWTQYTTDIGDGALLNMANIPADTTVRIQIGVAPNTVVNNLTFYPMLEAGSTKTEYEPYYHTTTPIPLPDRGWVAGLPDGTADSLRLDGAGKCEWEMPTNEVVLDGSSDEGWVLAGNSKRVNCPNVNDYRVIGIHNAFYASYFIRTTSGNTHNNPTAGTASFSDDASNKFFSLVRTGNVTTANDEKDWLSTNPVTILYPLATPITEDCGYVDMPDIPSDCVVTIPELDALGIRYFVDNSVTEYGKQIYARAYAELGDAIVELTERVATLEQSQQ